jgi:hypothetical protein
MLENSTFARITNNHNTEGERETLSVMLEGDLIHEKETEIGGKEIGIGMIQFILRTFVLISSNSASLAQ